MSSVLKVCSKQCNECLFSSNKIVSEERKNELLQGIKRDNSFFVCHKSTIKNETAMCRGFYERNKSSSLLIYLGHILKLIQFVEY